MSSKYPIFASILFAFCPLRLNSVRFRNVLGKIVVNPGQ